VEKLVYGFGGGKAEGGISQKRILGGKGAGLHEMTRLGIRVPPGFTIATSVCSYAGQHGGELPSGLERQVEEALGQLEGHTGRRFGDPDEPLLVSVRSGAALSMPGMMDTVLNLGLSDATLDGFARRWGGRRVALDAYRRLVDMFGDVVMGVPHERFDEVLRQERQASGVETDAELDEASLARVVEAYRRIYEDGTGSPFPQDPRDQLWAAIRAVVRSWEGERARTYRRLNHIEGLLGTAVNVQAMVFGNAGAGSASGVCFTRDPATGEDVLYGEYLENAQGEDVVGGIRTPRPISELAERMPKQHAELHRQKELLEKSLGDMQDVEFTVEEGTLFILQTRTGKRTGQAAVRIAVEMEAAGTIDRETALRRVSPSHLEQLLFPTFAPEAKREARDAGRLLATGLNAAPGVATGTVVFHPEEAEAATAHGAKVILVRHETSPEDVGGMAAAQGVLTATGGMTSHAAVVARGMGRPCVAGCTAVQVDADAGLFRVGDRTVRRNEPISIDGGTGEVFLGALPTSPSEIVQVLVRESRSPADAETYQRYATLMGWADPVRRMRVRANADTPEDARVAVALGAEGIGLCRTEHMFFAPERIPVMRAMILARTHDERSAALDRMAPLQRDDFRRIFQVMGERPVTVRLLDPPLHEFLPHDDEQQDALAHDLGIAAEEIARKTRELHEQNPMMGHRGCRLGITHPEIYDMQVRAIAEAAHDVAAEGTAVRPEIMMPLIGSARELQRLRARAEAVLEDVRRERGEGPAIILGTMIEVPRACVTAGEIARHADFFSFGTNDLTQCTWGISRDDGGAFLPSYLELGVLQDDPFQVIDRKGVGELMRIAISRGRAARPDLHLGICGEHGGEARSVTFCEALRLDYVSCSPYRLPVARLAAAQAALAATT
jgi:pyruvate,orthophosphate dikinase